MSDEIMGANSENYVIYDDKITEKITSLITKMSNEDAVKVGISRSNLFYLKQKLKKGIKMRFKKKTTIRLLKMIK